MVLLRIVGRPPALGDDLAIADNHQAVDTVESLIKGICQFK